MCWRPFMKSEISMSVRHATWRRTFKKNRRHLFRILWGEKTPFPCPYRSTLLIAVAMKICDPLAKDTLMLIAVKYYSSLEVNDFIKRFIDLLNETEKVRDVNSCNSGNVKIKARNRLAKTTRHTDNKKINPTYIRKEISSKC